MTNKVIYAIIASLLTFTLPAAAQSTKTLKKENQDLKQRVTSLEAELARLRDSLKREGGVITPAPAVAEPAGERKPSVWYTEGYEDEPVYDDIMEFDSYDTNVPDSVFIRRIEAMKCFFSLPYNRDVRNQILWYVDHKAHTEKMLGLSKYYFPIFEEALLRYGLPTELKYLAVIESALNPTAVSRVGARGLWQFMYNTGRAYGLEIDSFKDERMDPYKSSDAAARYLRDLYKRFGDWSLAISAYNHGPGGVMRDMAKSGKDDYWSAWEYFPGETQNYIPRFIGAMYAMTYYKEHGLKPREAPMPVEVDTVVVNKMLHFQQVKDLTGLPVDELRALNPQYPSDIIQGKGDILRIPRDYIVAFTSQEDSIYLHRHDEFFSPTAIQKATSARRSEGGRGTVTYTVRKGDTLSKIAKKYHTSVDRIKKANRLRSNNIRIGQKLKIPK